MYHSSHFIKNKDEDILDFYDIKIDDNEDIGYDNEIARLNKVQEYYRQFNIDILKLKEDDLKNLSYGNLCYIHLKLFGVLSSRYRMNYYLNTWYKIPIQTHLAELLNYIYNNSCRYCHLITHNIKECPKLSKKSNNNVKEKDTNKINKIIKLETIKE